ncbi:MAG: hypothetical protein ABI945_07450 [Nitrospirales bacterium]
MNTVTFLIVDNDVGCLPAERQTAQLHLHESKERFRLLVEQVKDYAIFMVDIQGRVMTWKMGSEVMKVYRATTS